MPDPITEAELLMKAAEDGHMDNPKYDPPDVAEVDNGDTEQRS